MNFVKKEDIEKEIEKTEKVTNAFCENLLALAELLFSCFSSCFSKTTRVKIF